LVAPATALVRKVVPPRIVRASTHCVKHEEELDRETLVRSLTETGYIRVPVVEDPGSFAVRGALLDVWPPGAPDPVRIELYGDMVVSIKPFAADAQTTKGKKDESLKEVWLPPARDAILTKENVARARDRVQQLAEMIDWPTTKTRVLVDDVATGR